MIAQTANGVALLYLLPAYLLLSAGLWAWGWKEWDRCRRADRLEDVAEIKRVLRLTS